MLFTKVWMHLQLCFRGIVHQHSLMSPTSEQTFPNWNERSNLYIGIGKQAYSGLPILKVPCAFGSWNFQSRGMVIGKPSLHVPCAPVYRTSREKDFGCWQTMVKEREGKEVGPTCGPTFFVIFLLDQAHLKYWRKNNCMNVHATDVSLLSAPWFGGWNSLRTR